MSWYQSLFTVSALAGCRGMGARQGSVGGGLAAPDWAFDPVNTWGGGVGDLNLRLETQGTSAAMRRHWLPPEAARSTLPRDKAVNLFRTQAAGPEPAPAVGEVRT